MEGLIPFVYKAIVQYKSGGQGMIRTWLNESPSSAYMRLPGDSGRFLTSEVQIFRQDREFSPPPSTTKRVVSARIQSPRHSLPGNSWAA
ncbi:hypothetical protein F511_31211 [Dorcoceras hygrometricum]|uniref:Uncharacterized protein n=1 Tax=Dorcoceras hygrometricum TaxID=472368 RepID=A0A2Z7BW40_9LAMI|nr:hypothetical protein F511_31211 [Dorcoceras hygrometricum]